MPRDRCPLSIVRLIGSEEERDFQQLVPQPVCVISSLMPLLPELITQLLKPTPEWSSTMINLLAHQARSLAACCLLFPCAQRIRYIASATPSALWIILGPFFLFDFFSHESAGCTARVEARAVFGRLVTLPPGTSLRTQTALLHRPELQTSEEDGMWWSLYFEICAT